MPRSAIVADWLAGWNGKNLELAMRHFADDAVFSSPSVLALGMDASGELRGRAAITALTAAAFARFPALRFEMERVIEEDDRIVMLYRKHGVFAGKAGLTVEIFDLVDGAVVRSTVYWGVEEVAARFRPREG
jgi:hypothetical protein